MEYLFNEENVHLIVHEYDAFNSRLILMALDEGEDAEVPEKKILGFTGVYYLELAQRIIGAKISILSKSKSLKFIEKIPHPWFNRAGALVYCIEDKHGNKNFIGAEYFFKK